jgi:hypothetical protein
VSGPTHGSISGTFPNLIYTPEADYVGKDSLAFKAYDATGESNSACVRIAVQPKSLIQPFQENSMKIGFFSILVIAMAGCEAAIKGIRCTAWFPGAG